MQNKETLQRELENYFYENSIPYRKVEGQDDDLHYYLLLKRGGHILSIDLEQEQFNSYYIEEMYEPNQIIQNPPYIATKDIEVGDYTFLQRIIKDLNRLMLKGLFQKKQLHNVARLNHCLFLRFGKEDTGELGEMIAEVMKQLDVQTEEELELVLYNVIYRADRMGLEIVTDTKSVFLKSDYTEV